MQLIEERVALLDTITLDVGAHETFERGHCAMEVVAWLAGEPHTDRPACVCPVIGEFVRSWNDGLPDDDRNRLLKPLLPRLAGTAASADVQDRRAFLQVDWAVRVFAPAWLRRAELHDDADSLANLPELSDAELCEAAMPAIGKVRESAAAARAAAGAAARDAAWAAAGAAARVAAWAAAGAATWTAAWAAARAAAGAAAGAATWTAAWAAARAAAWAAARDAVDDTMTGLQASAVAGVVGRDALHDTVLELQASAVDLLNRMIEVA